MSEENFEVTYVCPLCGKKIKIEAESRYGPLVEDIERFRNEEGKEIVIRKIIDIKCNSCKCSILVKPRPKSLGFEEDGIYDAV